MTEKKKPPTRIILIAIAIICVAVAVKFIFFKGEFLYAGTLEATKVDLSAKIPSTIGTMNVQEGDHVVENQDLVDLTCEDFKIDSNLLNENYNRNLRLFKAGSTAKEVLDESKNKKDESDVRVNWCVVRSPIHGTVLSRYHEPGEWVNPGNKLLTLANIQEIWAYIYVPQTEVFKYHAGMKLKAYLPEMNRREFMGTVLKVNDEAEFTPKNVQTESERSRLVIGIKVSFLESNKEEILKPGMTIEMAPPKD